MSLLTCKDPSTKFKQTKARWHTAGRKFLDQVYSAKALYDERIMYYKRTPKKSIEKLLYDERRMYYK